MNIVFFDVGGALVRCSHRDILEFLWRKREISLFSFLSVALLFFIHKLNPLNEKLVERITRSYYKKIVKGWTEKKMNSLAKLCFKEVIKPNIYPQSLELITNHKNKGDTIVLVSALLSNVIEELKKYIGADYAISPVLEIKDNKYTGNIIWLVPYGKNKMKMIKEKLSDSTRSFRGKYAYMDRISDKWIMEIVDNPCVVNPDRKLEKVARRRGWKIYKF